MREAGPGAACPSGERERGFMYVEVLVALALLAIVLVSMVPLFLLAARQNAASGDITVATNLALEKAEDLKLEFFLVMASGNDTVAVEDMRYLRTWTVTADSPHPGLRTVQIVVTPDRTTTYGSRGTATLDFLRSR